MDIFKQNRYLWITIIVLLIMNFTALALLWLGRPEARKIQERPPDPMEEQIRIQQLLKKELNFDETQSEQYLKLRRQHRNQVQQLQMDISHIKKQMFNKVLQDNPRQELSDSLLALAQEKQAQLEKITFQHFLDLKKLCKPEQQDKLKILLNEFFRKNAPTGINNDMPHPPAGARPAPQRGNESPPPLP
ncbi:MAG: hypothetical protein DWQ05_18595 [Calditrichaeota bacterium]|nr:MAG: hypothetical protein DWQ05_18595 [Calditrichota bacterium]